MSKKYKIIFFIVLASISYTLLLQNEEVKANPYSQDDISFIKNNSENSDNCIASDLPKMNLDLLKVSEQDITIEVKSFKLKYTLQKKRIRALLIKSFSKQLKEFIAQIDSYNSIPVYIFDRSIVI